VGRPEVRGSYDRDLVPPAKLRHQPSAEAIRYRFRLISQSNKPALVAASARQSPVHTSSPCGPAVGQALPPMLIHRSWGHRTQDDTVVRQHMSRGDGRRCKRRSSSARAFPSSSLLISATRECRRPLRADHGCRRYAPSRWQLAPRCAHSHLLDCFIDAGAMILQNGKRLPGKPSIRAPPMYFPPRGEDFHLPSVR
jgi:hypothetical protein